MINKNNIFSYIFGIIISTFLFFALYYLLSNNFGGNINPELLKNILPKFYVVQSGSMEPSLKVGSIVISLTKSSYTQGDIITFYKDGDRSSLVTHRIEFKLFPSGANSDPVYLTSGDSNEEVDQWQVLNKDVEGKVLLSIPYLGYLVDFAKKPQGLILFVIIPATIIVYEEIKKVLKELCKLIKKVSEEIKIRKLIPNKIVTKSINEDKINELVKNYEDINERKIKLKPVYSFNKRLLKASIFIPIIGSLLVISSLTIAYLFDNEISVGNIFGASDSFGPSIAKTLVMNELLPLSSCDAGQTNGQFLELWNGSGSDVNLKNFKLSDGSSTIAIANSNTNLPNEDFAILVKSNGVIRQCFGGDVNNAVIVNLGGQIDLNTATLQLLNSSDDVVDTIHWGPEYSLVPSINESIERSPLGLDTALGTDFQSTDFIVQDPPTPGLGISP